MLSLVAGRLAQMAATLLVVSALVWLVMGLMPGDPADLAMMSDPALTAADIERLRAAHGLDRPLHERYLGWLAAVLRGEFGFSRLYAVPAAQVLWPALGSTLVLLGASSRWPRGSAPCSACWPRRGRAGRRRWTRSRCWRNPCPASGSASC